VAGGPEDGPADLGVDRELVAAGLAALLGQGDVRDVGQVGRPPEQVDLAGRLDLAGLPQSRLSIHDRPAGELLLDHPSGGQRQRAGLDADRAATSRCAG
jgi:hypothetical protein